MIISTLGTGKEGSRMGNVLSVC